MSRHPAPRQLARCRHTLSPDAAHVGVEALPLKAKKRERRADFDQRANPVAFSASDAPDPEIDTSYETSLALFEGEKPMETFTHDHTEMTPRTARTDAEMMDFMMVVLAGPERGRTHFRPVATKRQSLGPGICRIERIGPAEMLAHQVGRAVGVLRFEVIHQLCMLKQRGVLTP